MIRREFRILYLHRENLLASLAFFILALFCLAIAFAPEEKILRRCGPALLWTLALLTTFFSTPLLLKADEHEGLLDEIFLQSFPPSFYLLVKIGAEYLFIGLPLVGLSVLLSSFFALSLSESLTLALTFLIGFPAISGLGYMGGLLTLHARGGGGVLLSLLILPLALPLLLLSFSVMEMTRFGLDSFPSFCLLTGTSLFLVILSVGAGSWALRLGVEG